VELVLGEGAMSLEVGDKVEQEEDDKEDGLDDSE
jgi:hypothetical protein